MTRCSICNSEHCAAIDDLADSGTATMKEIAQQFHCSYPALVRHCARHRNPAPATAPGSNGGDSQTEIVKWLQRADDQYLLASANADQRGAVTALVAGLRACEAQARNEDREEPAPVSPAGTACTIESLDAIIHKVMDEDPTWKCIEVIRQLDLETLQAIAKAALSGGMLHVTVNEVAEQPRVN
jgi:hypothetical protein